MGSGSGQWLLGEGSHIDVSLWSDEQLAVVAADISTEIHRRALAAGDPDEVAQWGFVECFAKDGTPVAPAMAAGLLLVVPGARVDVSSTRHTCTFASVDGDWVWNHPHVVCDVKRWVPRGRFQVLQTVTVLPAGVVGSVDLVSSKATGVVHKAQRSARFDVVGGGVQRAGVTNFPVRAAPHR